MEEKKGGTIIDMTTAIKPKARTEANMSMANIFEMPVDLETFKDMKARDLIREYKLSWAKSDNAVIKVHPSPELGYFQPKDRLISVGLIRIWDEQGTNPGGWIAFNDSDVIDAMGLPRHNNTYTWVREGLRRLAFTNLEFIDSFKKKQKNGKVRTIRRTKKFSVLKQFTAAHEIDKDSPDFDVLDGLKGKGKYVAQLDVLLIFNLYNGFARPVSLELWHGLTDRGLNLESFTSAALARKGKHEEDVFTVCEKINVIPSQDYGSREYRRWMEEELDKIKDDEASNLAAHSIRKSKKKKGTSILVLERKPKKKKTAAPKKSKAQTKTRTRKGKGNKQIRKGDDVQFWVYRMRDELRDKSTNKTNLLSIAQYVPQGIIMAALTETRGRTVDFQNTDHPIKNPTAYFVSVVKNMVQEKNEAGDGIYLPLLKD